MGAIHFSIDLELVQTLKQSLPVSTFVETGTFKGETTRSVVPFFDQIYTVELSPELMETTGAKLSEFDNVQMIHGSSPQVLSSLQSKLADKSVVYWLDAHWCGATTAGKDNECPLLHEINALGQLNDQSVVLIDDARLFLAPPPYPHNPSHWPSLSEVVTSLQSISAVHHLCIVNDVFIFAPPCGSNDG